MTLQMLEYFIALAENGSFTDAANACYISQPALSRAIASLEKELGCELVDRDKRKTVSLTPAGETLLIEAKRLFSQIDVMRERVKLVDEQSRREITIGYPVYGMLRDFENVIREERQELNQKNIRVRTVYGSTLEICERVQSGELDCIVSFVYSTYALSDCQAIKVYDTDMCAIVSHDHPLFDRKTIEIDELRHSKLVFFDPADVPNHYAAMLHWLNEADIVPRIAGFGKKTGDICNLCLQHNAIGIGFQSLDFAQNDMLHIIPVEGPKGRYKLPVMLVTRKNPVNPVVQQLFEGLENKQNGRL